MSALILAINGNTSVSAMYLFTYCAATYHLCDRVEPVVLKTLGAVQPVLQTQLCP